MSWEELSNTYKNSKEEVNPGLVKAYKYLKNQKLPCGSCNVTSTSFKSKYILPCYCTLCQECLGTGIEKIMDPIMKQVEPKKKNVDEEVDTSLYNNLPKCSKHNIPYLPERFVDLVSKKKLNEFNTYSLNLFNKKSNIL